jgi:peptidyl-tRNA hydrolase, PTH2 family
MSGTNIKQMVVVRKDLNMRKGKLAAQAAHASMKVFFDKLKKGPNESIHDTHTTYSLTVDNDAAEWIEGIFTKICVSVDSEAQLLEVYQKAIEKNLPCALIQDSGLTEFYFNLCKKCGDAIHKRGSTESCGYPICECGDSAEIGERIPVKTYTCCSIGPAKAELIDDITGKLSLL